MIIAIDIGGTKTLIAPFSSAGEPEYTIELTTNPNPQVFLAELVDNLKKIDNITTLSIAVPGIVDRNGKILRCGNLKWQDFALKELLSKHFSCPILIENDADLAGLYEINHLPQKPILGLYITVSTGIGIGLIIEGKLIHGLHRTEGGRILVPNDQNNFVIWESIASGRAIHHHFNKFAKELTLDTEWQWVADKICLGLYSLIPALEPDVIVFGGSVGQFLEKFSAPLIANLTQHISSYTPLPQIIKAAQPTKAVIYGCNYNAKHFKSTTSSPY